MNARAILAVGLGVGLLVAGWLYDDPGILVWGAAFLLAALAYWELCDRGSDDDWLSGYDDGKADAEARMREVGDRGLDWIAWDWPERRARAPMSMDEFARAYRQVNDRRTEYARWAALHGFSAVKLSYEPTAFERRQECEPPAVFDHQGR